MAPLLSDVRACSNCGTHLNLCQQEEAFVQKGARPASTEPGRVFTHPLRGLTLAFTPGVRAARCQAKLPFTGKHIPQPHPALWAHPKGPAALSCCLQGLSTPCVPETEKADACSVLRLIQSSPTISSHNSPALFSRRNSLGSAFQDT